MLEVLEDRLAPAALSWTGAIDSSWSNPANWDLGRAPLAGDDLTFGPTTGNKVTSNDLASMPAIRSITISAAGYTLVGNDVALTGPLTVNASLGIQTIGLDLVLSPPPASLQQTFTINTNSTLILSGQLSGGTNAPHQTLTKAGAGTLELLADNRAFSGAFTLANSGGVVVVGHEYALGNGAVVSGAPNAGLTTVNPNSQLQVRNVVEPITTRLRLNGSGISGDGALLNVAGTTTWAGRVDLDSATTIGAVANTTLNISGQIGDLGAGHNLVKEGAGRIIFSHLGGNTYRGTTTVNNGILTIRNPLALGAGADPTKPQNGQVTSQTVVNYNPITGQAGTLQLDFDTLADNDPSGIVADPTQPYHPVNNPYVGFQVFRDRVVLNGPGFNNLGALHNARGNNIWNGPVILGSVLPNPRPANWASTAGNVFVGVDLNSELKIQGVVSSPNRDFQLDQFIKILPGRLVLDNANTYTISTVVATGALNIRDSRALGIPTSLPFVGQVGGMVFVNSSVPGTTLELEVDSGLDGTPLRNQGRNLGFDSVRGSGGDTQEARTVQEVYVPSTTGSFTLTFNGATTGSLSSASPTLATQIATQLNALSTIAAVGGVTVQQNGDVFRVFFTNTSLAGNIPVMSATSSGGAGVVVSPRYGLTISNDVYLLGQNAASQGGLRSISGRNIYSGTIYLQNTGAVYVDADTRPGHFTADNSYLTFDYQLQANNISDPRNGTGGRLTKSGPGHLMLPTGNPYSGETEITAGWVTIQNNTSLGRPDPNFPPVNQNLRPYTIVHAGAALHLLPTGTGSLSPNNNLRLQGLGIDHPFELLNQAGAVTNLGGVNTLTGLIQLNGVAGIGVEQTNPAITSLVASQLLLPTPISNFGATTGGITKLGSRRLVIETPASYTGPVDVAEGVLLVRHDQALGLGPSTVTVQDGAALEVASSQTHQNGGVAAGLQVWNHHLILNGAGNPAFGDTALTILTNNVPITGPISQPLIAVDTVWRGRITLNGSNTITIPTGSRLVLTGDIDDGTMPSDLIIAGGGELYLAGNNTYRGTTYVGTPSSPNVLTVANSRALGGTGIEEVQQLTLTGFIAGETFQLTFGTELTGNIAYTGNVATDTAAIAAALNALPSIGDTTNPKPRVAGVVTVTSPAAGVFNISFGGSMKGFEQTLLSAAPTSGSGDADVVRTVRGAGATIIAEGSSLQLVGSITVAGEPLLVHGNGGAVQSVPTQWHQLGPAPITNGQTVGNGNVTGRVTASAVDPTDPNVIYIATAGGGAWKTIDGGRTWRPIFDAIPEIQRVTASGAFDLSFTGEDAAGNVVTRTANLPANATAEQVTAALNALDNIGGVGGLVTVVRAGNVYTITFGGTLAGYDVNQLVPSAGDTVITVQQGKDPRFAMYIGAIAVDPQNYNTIYIGTGETNNAADTFYGTGIYKSTNAGVTWQLLTSTVTQDITVLGTTAPQMTTFTVSYPDANGNLLTTGDININAGAGGVQSAINTSGILPAGASVTVTATPIREVQKYALANPTTGQLVTSGVTYVLQFGGQFVVDVTDPANPVPFAYNASAATIQAGIDAVFGAGQFLVQEDGIIRFITFVGANYQYDQPMWNVGWIPDDDPNTVDVLGSQPVEATKGGVVYHVRFAGSLANAPVDDFEVDRTGGPNSASATLTYVSPYNPFDGKGISKIQVFDHDNNPATEGHLYVTSGDGGTGQNQVETLLFSNHFPNTVSTFTISFTGADITGAVITATTPTLIYFRGNQIWTDPSTGVSYQGNEATAAQIQYYLNQLPNIGGVGGSVIVRPPTGGGGGGGPGGGGPGGGGGGGQNRTFTVIFGGTLGQKTLPGLFTNYPEPPVSQGTPFISTTITRAGGPLTVVNGTVGDPGVWWYNPATTTWDNLVSSARLSPSSARVGTVSTNAANTTHGPSSPFVAGLWNSSTPAGNTGPLGFPKTAGPEDNYRITFPTADATWSDVGIGFDALGRPILIAALGSAGGSVTVNGIYWTPDIGSATPRWYAGNPSSTSDPYPFVPDNSAGGQFPTGISSGVSNGNIKFSVVQGGTTNFDGNGVETVRTSAGNINTTLPGTHGSGGINAGGFTIFASVSLPTGQLRAVYVSTNGGVNWAPVGGAGLGNYLGVQGQYNNAILAINTSTIYVGGSVSNIAGQTGQIFRSTDGGANWTDISILAGNSPHSSQHTITRAGEQVLFGGDGGIWRLNAAATAWTNINGNLAISQVNSVASIPNSINTYFAGIHNNGTARFDNDLVWQMVDTTAGGQMGGWQVAVDPLNPLNVYAVQTQFGQPAIIRRSLDGGNSWTTILASNFITNRTAPLVVDSINPNRILVGGEDPDPNILRYTLYESHNQGNTWTDLRAPISSTPITIVAVPTYQGPFVADSGFPQVFDKGASTYDGDTIYVSNGTDLYVTKDHAQTWVERELGDGAGGFIQLLVDPRNREVLYGVRNSFGFAQVWRSTDGGRTWVTLTQQDGYTGLGDLPVWKLVLDPRNDNLYVGTDIGVFRLTPGSTEWKPFGTGLPSVQVHDLVLDQGTNTLIAGTYGRGVYQFFLDAPDTAASPTRAALLSLSGTAVWTGPIILGSSGTNTVTIGAQGTQALANGISAAQLDLVGRISDLSPTGGPQLLKVGQGDVVLAGDNVYGGHTHVLEGALVIDNPHALGDAANGTTVHDGSVLQLRSSLYDEPVTLFGDGYTFGDHYTGSLRNLSGSNEYTGPLTLATHVTIGTDSGSQLTISGPIGDLGTIRNLHKELTGTLVFTAANTYGGFTHVMAGALQVQHAQALGTTANGTHVYDGAQLQMHAPNGVPLVISGEELTLSGTGIFNTGAILATNGDNVWNGPITLDSRPVFLLNGLAATIPPGTVAFGAVDGATLTIDGTIDDPFSLSGATGLPATEFESNDTPNDANILDLVANPILAVNGSISDSNDVDYFTFTVTTRTGIFFDIDSRRTGISNTLDSYLEIFAAGDLVNPLVFNDNGYDFGTGYPAVGSLPGSTTADSSLYYDFAPGTYFVRMSSVGGTIGDYVLNVRAETDYSTTVPVLNSNPGATHTLFLDFNGHAATDWWGTYNMPGFDFNGDHGELTPAEKEAIRNIWRTIAEDFSPFDINVTTSYSGGFGDGEAYRMVFTTDDGSGVGATGSLGVAFLDGYSVGGLNSKVGWVFVGNFGQSFGDGGGGSGQIVATAIEQGNTGSHEFGHALGLRHYNSMPGGFAGNASIIPGALMATPDFGLNRETWAVGDADLDGVATVFQDDMAVIASLLTYRADDHANTMAGATLLPQTGNTFLSSGIISEVDTDVDYFRFVAVGGQTTIQVLVSEAFGNLVPALRVFDANGVEIASGLGNPFGQLSISITLNLTAGAVYYLEVASDGEDGSAGQYRVFVGPPGSTPGGGSGSTQTLGLQKVGLGTVLLKQDNNYGGVTTVSEGILVVQHPGALGATFNGTVVQNGAALELDGSAFSFTVSDETLTLNGFGIAGTGALRNTAGDNTWNGPIVLQSASALGADDATHLTLSGGMSAGFLTIVNPGTVIFPTMVGLTNNQTLTTLSNGYTQVDGVIGDVLFDSGALTGTGTVGRLSSNFPSTGVDGGTLSPGAGVPGSNTIETLTTVGNGVLNSSDLFFVDLGTSGVNDLLRVSNGTLDLGFTSLDGFLTTYTIDQNGGTSGTLVDIAVGSSYTIVLGIGSGTITGQFAGAATDPVDPTASYATIAYINGRKFVVDYFPDRVVISRQLAATGMTLAASVASPVYGQIETFTVTFAPEVQAPSPTGVVVFHVTGPDSVTTDYTVPIVVNPNTGVATATWDPVVATGSPLSLGTYLVTASYDGLSVPVDSPSGPTIPMFNPTGSNSVSVTVNPANTTTVLATMSSAVYGANVAITATVSSTVSPLAGNSQPPTGTVSFYRGTVSPANLLGTSPLSTTAGVTTAVLNTSTLSPSLVVGSHSIIAVYNSDGTPDNHNGSTSVARTLTVTRANTTVSVVSNTGPSVYGQPVTFTATINVTAPGGGTLPPTGTVTFRIGGTELGNGTLSTTGGITTATYTTTTLQLPVGNLTISATYNGDGNHNSSVNSVSQQVTRASTTVGLGASTTTPVYGQPVTFTATVAVVSPGGGLPTGTVTFLLGGNQIGTGTLATISGVTSASYTTTFGQLDIGAGQEVTAVYAGSTNHVGNLSAPLSIDVAAANTATTVLASPSTSAYGQRVTFTATVSASSPGTGNPTGTVSFYLGVVDPGNLLGTGTLALSGGLMRASYQTTELQLPVGVSQSVIAVFTTDTGRYVTSTGTVSQTVNAASTTTTLGSSASPAVYGQSVTFTATVTTNAPGSGLPSGDVNFFVGTGVDQVLLGTGTLTQDGSVMRATYTTTSFQLMVGANQTITAEYVGDGNYASSTRNIPQTVNKAGTSTILVSDDNSSVFGQEVTFTATVSANAPGSGTPTGDVVFKRGSVILATVPLVGGVAEYSTSGLPLSTGSGHTITAEYAGDNHYLASTQSITQVVSQASTTTGVTSSLNPSQFGQLVTFTATVTVDSPGVGDPTGTVTFLRGSTTLGPGIYQGNGVWTYSTSSLPVGQGQVITANFVSSSTNFGHSSGTVQQDVNAAPTSTSVVTSGSPSTFGQQVTFTATVSAASGNPSGNVQFYLGSVAPANLLGTRALALVSGQWQASYTTTAFQLPAGVDQSVIAVYTGDFAFASSQDTVLQTVNQAATTTTVASSAPTAVYGQAVTFTATVSGPGTLAGNVTFYLGTMGVDEVEIGTGNLALVGGQWRATYTTTPFQLTVSPARPVVAVFNGSTNHAGSTSTNAVNQTVNQAATTTVVGSSLSPSTFGDVVTFTATVTTNAPGSGLPSGDVNFFVGTGVDQVLLGTGTLTQDGSVMRATYTTGAFQLQGGVNQTIAAVYVGDGNYAVSAGTRSQTVAARGTDTALTLTDELGNPVTRVAAGNPNTPITLTAIVVRSGGGSDVPTGTVTFRDTTSGLVLGTVNLVNGEATLEVVFTQTGNRTIVARYDGDGNYAASTSPAANVFVTGTANTTRVVQSSSPRRGTPALHTSYDGQAVTFTAVIADPNRRFTPNGTVTFLLNGTTVLGTVNLTASAVGVARARLVISDLPINLDGHLITAEYSGNGRFAAGTSAALTQVVQDVGDRTSVTLLAVTPANIRVGGVQMPATSEFGQAVTLTARVRDTGTGPAIVPNGTIYYRDGFGNLLGTGRLVSWNATTRTATYSSITTRRLPVGDHTLQADFGGNFRFARTDFSTSPNATRDRTVIPARTTTRINSTAPIAVFGQTVTLAARPQVVAPGSTVGGLPTGTVTFMAGTTVVAADVPVIDGVARFVTTDLPLGVHRITAEYSGDENFKPSTSVVLVQRINRAGTRIIPTLSTFQPDVPVDITVTVRGLQGSTLPPSGGIVTLVVNNGLYRFSTFLMPEDNGQVVFTLAAGLRLGFHTLTFSYSGDANFGPSSISQRIYFSNGRQTS